MRAHRNISRRCVLILCCGTLGGLAAAGDARAADKVWISTSGNWTADAKWSPFGRPGDLDNAVINNSPNGVVVYYQVDGGQFHTFGNITVSRMELRVQQSMGAAAMSLSGLTTSLLSVENGASVFIGSTTIGLNGVISTTGNGSRFHATDITQADGRLLGPTTVQGTYLLNGGTFGGVLTNNGTFNYSAGTMLAGALINNGTLIHNGPATGLQSLDVHNHGPMVFNTSAAFASLRNDASSTLPLGRSLDITSFTFHRGGTFTQLGNVKTTSLSIGSATWDQHSGTLSIPGSQFSQGELQIGMNGGPGVSLPGRFLLRGGSLRTDLIDVGSVLTTGTYEQSGGGVLVTSVTIGNRLDSRGTFNMSGGTFLASSLQLGRENAAAGTLNQSGGSLSVASASLNGMVNVSGGTFQTSVGGPAQPMTNHGIIRQSGGYTNLGAVDGAGRIEVTGAGSMSAGRIRQHAVHVGGNGRITTVSNDPATHVVPLLSFEESAGTVRGTWDLADGALVVDYNTDSPSAAIRRYLKSGYASGSWNGTGLNSSAAQADPGGTTALGYAASNDVLGASGGVFAGALVDGSAVLVRYTRHGDANLDELVNLNDFNRLASNFGGSGKGWSPADFNYDGAVNLADFNALASNFGLSASSSDGPTAEDWAALAAAVPEPTVTMLSAVAASAALLRSRRRTS